jgi:ubiquitin-protein ligase
MSDVRFQNEIQQLARLGRLLSQDARLTLRLQLEPRSVRWREFVLKIDGISGLVIAVSGPYPSTSFAVYVRVPSAYPAEIPKFQFLEPVPFHPHVWPSGAICWGSQQMRPRPDLMLIDWVRSLIDYLQFSQDADIVINRNSPANRAALIWYEANGARLRHYVPRIDMARLRVWLDRARA